MKKLFTILSWFSLFLVLVTLPLSFSSSYTWVSTGQLGSGAGYFVTWLAAIIALIFVLIGWIVSKPGYLWLGAILTGLLYLASHYAYYVVSDLGVWKTLVILAPGILLVVEGVILKLIQQKLLTRSTVLTRLK